MSVVDEIKERLDVVEVISSYVPLRKSGRIYKALCPFHQEKTPSFVVYPDTGTWRCFGACGVGGDIFTFVMKRENVDFREALELLAGKAGVELEPATPAQSQHSQYLDRLREINQAAALYFHSQLRQSSQAQVARAYLAKRGLDEATIEGFLLGYAPESWDGLLRHLLDKNYEQDDILAAGLIVEKIHDDGRVTYYDRFRQRVMVPIQDVQGRTIGFGARALSDQQQPKYLNTSQTPLFDKSSVLFGLDKARKAIRAREKAIIVEGYMDVLACHQYGETNVVASMGTALTDQQLKQLKRYTNTFVLALDADTAGQAATLRGIAQARAALDREWVPTLTAQGMLRHEARLTAQLRIMALPEGQDPDDVVRTDPTRWQVLVDAAKPVVDFYFDLVRAEVDLSTAQGKSEAVERLAPLILEVADEVQRAHYMQQLARLIQTDERTVERLVLRRQAPPAPRATESQAALALPDAGGARRAEGQNPKAGPGQLLKALQAGPATHCLALLVVQPRLLQDVQAELASLGVNPLDEDDFGQADERAICAALLAGEIQEGGTWPGADPSIAQRIEQLRTYGQQRPSLPWQQMLKDTVDAVLRLRIENLKARTRLLPALVREAEAEGLFEDARAYQNMGNDLKEYLRILQQTLNARTNTGRRQSVPSR